MLSDQIPETFRKRFDELKSMRDEMRVRLHLGGMDARNVWDKLGESLEQFEHRASVASGAAAGELSQSLEKIASALKDLSTRLEQPRR